MHCGSLASIPLVLMAAMISGFMVSHASEPQAVSRPPNVVLIVSDDQHWGDYGFMGHPHLRTPSLDRLAAESLVFRHGYVPSSLCCPSLASLITGRYPHEHGIVGNDPPEIPGVAAGSPEARQAFQAGRAVLNRRMAEWPTLPRLLAAHGYHSLQTGKWWQGDFSQGGFTEGMTKGGRHGDEGLAIGRSTMAPIKDFIGRCRAAGTPFLVWYAPMLPHDPHDPPQELVDHYATRTDSIHVARYWGNVERFDRTVGELLDHLDQEQLAADTLVVYVADNGWLQNAAAPRFAVRSKQSPHDGGLRTPIMLRRPGVIAPATSDALASSLDILPTVLAACGIEAPAGLPGVNLLDEQAVAERTQVFGECYSHTIVDLDEPERGLLWRWTVRGDWKLIAPAAAPPGLLTNRGPIVDELSQGKHERGEAELYNLATDPRENDDVAAAHPELVGELRQSIDAWWTPKDAAKAAAQADPGRKAAAAARRSPNLLVFLADDLGAHDLGCTGSTFYRTPAIDRLAAEGQLFTRGYAACPVCSPTRAALVTGRHPARVGITNFIAGRRQGRLLPAPFLHELPAAETTVAELLVEAGYATSVFGKWHLGDAGAIPAHGFATSALTTVGPGSGPANDPLYAGAIAAAASEFIRSHADRPWFCFVSLHSVHVPLVTRPELAAEEGRAAAAGSRSGHPHRARPPRVRRHGAGDGRGRGHGTRRGRRDRSEPGDARGLHQRQRRPGHGGRGAHLEPAAPGRQGLRLRGGHSRAAHRPLARRGTARFPKRCPGDHARSRRNAPARSRDRDARWCPARRHRPRAAPRRHGVAACTGSLLALSTLLQPGRPTGRRDRGRNGKDRRALRGRPRGTLRPRCRSRRARRPVRSTPGANRRTRPAAGRLEERGWRGHAGAESKAGGPIWPLTSSRAPQAWRANRPPITIDRASRQ